MHWLYLLASLACLGLAMVRSMPTPLVMLFVLGSLVGLVAWAIGWMAHRVSGASRDIGHIMSPDELRRLREQAEARKAAPPGQDDNDRP
jgi:hypothetical protein